MGFECDLIGFYWFLMDFNVFYWIFKGINGILLYFYSIYCDFIGF